MLLGRLFGRVYLVGAVDAVLVASSGFRSIKARLEESALAQLSLGANLRAPARRGATGSWGAGRCAL